MVHPQASIQVDSAAGAMLRRKCACGGAVGKREECESCRQVKALRRRAGGAEPAAVPPVVYDVLRSPGCPLDRDARALMEPRFGHDFSRVRIHNDARAASAARAANAHAFTVGQDIVFDRGQFDTGSKAGQQLLAHELTHTLQQRSAFTPDAAELTVGAATDGLEAEADAVANAVIGGAVEWRTSAPIVGEEERAG
jgi:hypothetical protein